MSYVYHALKSRSKSRRKLLAVVGLYQLHHTSKVNNFLFSASACIKVRVVKLCQFDAHEPSRKMEIRCALMDVM